MNKKILGIILLSLAASIWGGMFVVVKSIVGVIPPVQLVWLRYLIAIVALGVLVIVKHAQWHIIKRDAVLIVLVGIIGNGISIVAQETGTMFSSAQLGSVITSATPTFMVLFAFPLLKEKINSVKVISVLLATAGVVLIVGVHLAGAHIVLGICMLTIAALTWALMSVLVKLVSSNLNAVQVTFLSTCVAFVGLTPFVISQWSLIQSIDFTAPKIYLNLLYLGIVSTVGAFVMWNKGLQLLNAGSAGLFFLLQPIVGTLLGWLILGEQLSIGFLFGALLIIGSVWYSIRFAK